MRGYGLLVIVSLGLLGPVPAPPAAQGVPGSRTIAFEATVRGAVRDRGTVSAPQGLVTVPGGDTDVNGCAIVKNKLTQAPFGASRFTLHINYLAGINLMLDGIRPSVEQEVALEVLDYRATVSTYNAKLSLAFVIGRHLYFTGTHTTVTLRHGGLDGTISSRDVLRSYPTRVSDLLVQAHWHCATLFHVLGKV